MTQLWAVEMAEQFWALAGGPPSELPRDLRRGVAYALPLAIVDMPRPHVGSINGWLADRGFARRVAEQDRPVRAGLVILGDSGIVFLDGADPDDERRFSLAHEVAHYWLEHSARRAEVEARLGADAVRALDGARAPTARERMGAVLAGISFEPSVHLMLRDANGSPLTSAVTLAERRADALALELLAPIELVTARLDGRRDLAAVEAELRETFGLPDGVATAYARSIVPDRPASDLLQRLRSVSHFRSLVGNRE